MRKNIFKKFVATLATAAMAVGMVAAPTMDAYAANSYAYVVGINGSEWGMDHTLTSTDGVNYTGEIDFSAGGDISILLTENDWDSSGTITSWNGNTNVYAKDGRDAVWFLGDSDEAGTYTVNYNKDTGVVTANIKAVSTTVWTYEYYVAGEATLEAELWSNSDTSSYGTKGKMTKSDTTWTYTAKTSADFKGTDGYNIIKIGVPDDDSARTIEWLKDGSNPFACNYTGAGTLTITYDEESGASEAKFVADSTNSNTDNTDTNTNTDNNTNTNNNTNTDNNTNTSNTNTGNTATGNTTSSPNTGDSTTVALYLALAALSAVVVLKKTKVEA